jgi:hypothetical protein
MALILDGNGLIQGLDAGGLPSGSVNADSLASTLDLSSKTMTFGNVSASGITFPATQSASGNANTLDDYEQGTWTPVLAFGGASVGVVYNARRVGVYTKIGNIVTINCFLAPTDVGSSTGDVSITGLPFQAASSGQASTGGVMLNGVTNSGTTVATIDTNAIVVAFYTTGTNGTRAQLNKTDFSNNDEVAFTITYFTA